MRKKNPKKHVLQWWMSPKADEHGQWWWGYQKVRLVVLPEEEKQKFIDSFNFKEKKSVD